MMMEADYKEIFEKIESMVLEKENVSEFKKVEGEVKLRHDYFLGKYPPSNISPNEKKNLIEKMEDENIWQVLAVLPFWSRKATQVEKKQPLIIKEIGCAQKTSNLNENQKKLIKNKLHENTENVTKNKIPRNKLVISFENSKVYNKTREEYGSFKNYVLSFGEVFIDEAACQSLINDFDNKFLGIAEKLSYHFFSDMGLSIQKPDSVIRRIYYRLGFIEKTANALDVQRIFKKFVTETGKNYRYIDLIIVKFGQKGNSKRFETEGICTEKNPKCNICKISKYCKFYKENK